MFAFRIRAYAAAHFEWDDHLTVTWPNAVCVLQSEYTGGDHGRAYPVTIHGEIRGEDESLEDAQRRLSGLIGETLPTLALASNAAIATPLAVAAYGVDLTRPQPFLGYRTPDSRTWFPPGKRRIDLHATEALMGAVGNHPETELLRRAIEAYRHALGHWIPEERLLSAEFLYIAAETLSRFLVKSQARTRGISTKNLARLHGFNKEEKLRASYLREIFNGDEDALVGLERASNGFEHGYMAPGEALSLAEPVLERSFACLRPALLRAAGVDDASVDRLLSQRYDEPRSLVPTLNVVRGELSLIDSEHPRPELDVGAIDLSWTGGQPTVVESTGGEAQISFQWDVKVTNLPDNVQLKVTGQGMRAAYVKPAKSPDAE